MKPTSPALTRRRRTVLSTEAVPVIGEGKASSRLGGGKMRIEENIFLARRGGPWHKKEVIAILI